MIHATYFSIDFIIKTTLLLEIIDEISSKIENAKHSIHSFYWYTSIDLLSK